MCLYLESGLIAEGKINKTLTSSWSGLDDRQASESIEQCETIRIESISVFKKSSNGS